MAATGSINGQHQHQSLRQHQLQLFINPVSSRDVAFAYHIYYTAPRMGALAWLTHHLQVLGLLPFKPASCYKLTSPFTLTLEIPAVQPAFRQALSKQKSGGKFCVPKQVQPYLPLFSFCSKLTCVHLPAKPRNALLQVSSGSKLSPMHAICHCPGKVSVIFRILFSSYCLLFTVSSRQHALHITCLWITCVAAQALHQVTTTLQFSHGRGSAAMQRVHSQVS